jgi:hypothetical protein
MSNEADQYDTETSSDPAGLSVTRTFIRMSVSASFLLVAACTVIVRYLSSEQLSIVGMFFLCLFAGALLAYAILEKKGPLATFGMNAFVFTYSVNVILAVALEEYYLSEYGRAFLWNAYMPGSDTVPLIQYGSTFIRNASTGVNDDLKFHIVGTAIARDWIRGSHDSAGLLKYFSYVGYPWLVGVVLYIANLFGDMSPLGPRFVNSMFGGLLIVSIFSLSSSVYSPAIGVRAATISSIFPVLNFYAANTFRDIVIAFLLVTCTLLLWRLITPQTLSRAVPSVCALIMCGVGLLFLRSPALYVLVTAYIVYFSLFGEGILKRLALGAFGAGLLILMLLNSQTFSNQTIDYLAKQGESWNESRVEGSTKASLAIKYIYSAPQYISAPLSIVYMVFMPVPPISSFTFPGLLEGAGALAWYFFVPFWIWGVAKSLKDKDAALPVITCLVLFLSVAYIGGALRHKMQFMVFAFMQASYAAEVLRGKVLSVGLATALTLLILAGVYTLLKF